MDKNSQNNHGFAKEHKTMKGDLGSIGIGAAIAGPAGALIGLGANRLYRWARERYLKNQEKKANTTSTNDVKKNNQNKTSEKDLNQKVKDAQDAIMNSGIFEPEIYNNYKFYQTTIYDSDHPEENNFVYISKKRNAKKAYNSFLEYWAQKYKEKKKNAPIEEVNNFIKLVQERFKLEANKPCLISVPQYFFIDNFDVLSMAKNSDIINNNNVVYYDRPSFDSNFAFDTHMYKHKNESKEEESIEKYKITIVSYNIFGLNYVYATDSNTRPDTDNVLLNIADNLSHWGEGAHINDNKYKFTRWNAKKSLFKKIKDIG